MESQIDWKDFDLSGGRADTQIAYICVFRKGWLKVHFMASQHLNTAVSFYSLAVLKYDCKLPYTQIRL